MFHDSKQDSIWVTQIKNLNLLIAVYYFSQKKKNQHLIINSSYSFFKCRFCILQLTTKRRKVKSIKNKLIKTYNFWSNLEMDSIRKDKITLKRKYF